MPPPPEIRRIEEQMGFQRRFWAVERIGWLAMAGLIVAALLGLSGAGGPIASAQRQVDGVSVGWPRFQRLGRAAAVRVVLPPGMATAPAPALHAPAPWRLRDVTGAADGREVTLHVEPTGAPGPRQLRLVVAGRMLDLPVFVWP
jgi:hypothetical protein